jgi:hypothetical protein
MSAYKYTKKAQRYAYDVEQAKRRTPEQNRKIIEIIQVCKCPPGTYWGYSDIPPEGGPVDLACIALGKRWIIQTDGTAEERPYVQAH